MDSPSFTASPSLSLASPGMASCLSELVGNTPVLRLSDPLAPAERGFWAKLEGFNPAGIKDRPALHLV